LLQARLSQSTEAKQAGAKRAGLAILAEMGVHLQPTFPEAAMQTLDEMLALQLLTADEHAAIGAHARAVRTPEAILQMPEHLWKALAMATVLLDMDSDPTQPH
jgi:hypothetical protein